MSNDVKKFSFIYIIHALKISSKSLVVKTFII